MIEKSCKIELKDIDFVEIRCQKCKSKVSIKNGNIPNQCPVCSIRYNSLVVGMVDRFLEDLSNIKNQNIDIDISFVSIEETK